MDLRIGCSSWTSPAWADRFYPPGLPDGDRLAYYARSFDTVEVDATYYATPNPFVVRGWARKTPENFRFALKATRELFDPKKPRPPGALDEFVATARQLGPKLGPILLQFSPWFKPPKSGSGGNLAFLEALVRELPEGTQFAVELRDKDWFAGERLRAIGTLFRSREVAFCWSSLTYVEVPPERTAPWAYLRFIGDHETVPAEVHGTIRVDRTPEMRHWAGELRRAEVDSAWAFFNNHFAGYAPTSANQFREELGLPPVAVRDPSAGTLEGFDRPPAG